MPVKQAAFKALRQDKKRAERNRVAKLEIRDARRAVRKALEAGKVKEAGEAAKKAVRLLDKAYSRGIMKLNTISRVKSRLLATVAKASKK